MSFPQLLPAILTAFFLASFSQAREIRMSELQPFAKNFKCSNPKLQWQFDRTLTLMDENQKMRAKSSSPLPPIYEASGVGGEPGLLYRGVTNSQFNESHILALIFNDSVAVSESRWLSSQIFQKSNLWKGTPAKHEFVPMRSSFRALPEDVKWKAFTEAYLQTTGDIKNLLNTNQFDEHIRIGSPLNATPQSIQFLTPHRSYAEGYGEFVLHIREVVRRGVDVERYNYHNPNWSYRIGTIYIHDRDEYEVPTSIPSWDVEAVKVRSGTGWHQGNYGPALYFYSKIYEKENPCNVIGIRVDKADASDNDNRRIPEGVILKCPQKNGAGCTSMLQGNFPNSTFQRLTQVLQDTKIDGHPVYYLPYNVYQSGNPDILKQMNLATVISAFTHIKDDLKKDESLWLEILQKNFSSEIGSAVKLVQALPVLKNASTLAAFQRALLSKTNAWIQSAKFKLDADEISPLIEWLNWLGVKNSNAILDKMVQDMIDSPESRLVLLRDLNKLASQNIPLALPLRQLATQKAQSLQNLNPLQELQLYVTLNPQAAKNEALIDKTAKAVSHDPAGFAASYFAVFGADTEKAADILEAALSKATKLPKVYPLGDTLQLWTSLASTVKTTTRSASILGLCIDYEIAFGKRTAFEISRLMPGIGLPADREIDTVRALWSLAQDESQRTTGTKTLRFALLADGFRTLIFDPHLKTLDAAGAADFQELVLNYYGEFMSPPQPLVSFAALNTVRRFNNKDLVFKWPDEKGTKIKIGNSELTLSAVEHRSILLQSLSTYYLNILRNELATQKDPKEQQQVQDVIRKVLEGYRNVALNNLDQMLTDDVFAGHLKERFQWNHFENTLALVDFLAEMAPSRSEKQKLKQLVDKMARQFPEMDQARKDESKPQFFTKDSIEAWKNLMN